jgi:Carboxypeptidase regulatory-like domain
MLTMRWSEEHPRRGLCDRALLLKAAFLLLMFAVPRLGQTQQAPTSVSAKGLLGAPNSLASGVNGTAMSRAEASSSISGIVLDANGGTLINARITLTSANNSEERTLLSGSNGEFSFSELLAGDFKLTITSPGMEPFVFSDIALSVGERRELPSVSMAIAATTTEVQVVVTQTELAQEQVKAAEHQRVLGVLPNFYSSYIWDAAPLDAKQKFDLAFHSIADPVEFVGTGIVAGAEQATDTFPGYGQGAHGYAKRYGAAYADDVLGRLIGSAILPSALHQDPRYFYRGSGTVRSRVFYAVSRALVTRGDDGRTEPNYSRLLGSFAASGLANLYYPRADRGLGLTLGDGLVSIAGHAVDNLIREFFLRRLTPNVPGYERGQP